MVGLRTQNAGSQSALAESPAKPNPRTDGQSGLANTAITGNSMIVDNEAPPETTQLSRREYLVDELKTILSDISGMESDELDEDTSFIKLGFDSLFLTQASTAFKKKFNIRISFRQLLESTSSINALAEFLDEQLNPDQFQPPSVGPEVNTATDLQAVAETPMSVQQAGTLPLTNGTQSSSADPLHHLINQQIKLLSQQVAALAEASAALGAESRPVNTTADQGVPAATPKTEPMAEIKDKHGPWRQINKSAQDSVSAANRAALDALVSAYVEKSGRSKAYAQKHCRYFADPRSISSFNKTWKEMVYPLVTQRSAGSRMWDIDGNEYLDVQSGFGSVFFGHNMPFINDAITHQLESGMQIGPQCHLAGEVAAGVCEITGMECATFCNTGSEAVLAAMRIARTVTGNNKVVMFAQDYHGIFDEVVSRRAGSMSKLKTLPAAPGVPPAAVDNIVILDYGDPDCFEILEQIADEVAAVMVEPVQSRQPDLQPVEFLKQLRDWTEKNSVVLIFDEVITGFRLHPRGAQGWYGIDADLCTYGKIIGGGMPLGMLAGRSRYMDALDGGTWQFGDDSVPEAGVTYFAGTFVRHPLTVAAAKAVVLSIKEQGADLYNQLNKRSDYFAATVNACFDSMQVPMYLQHCGSMMYLEFLTDSRYNPLYFYYLRLQGIHILDAGSFFLTLAHTDEDIELLINKFEPAARWMQQHEFLPSLDGNKDRTLVCDSQTSSSAGGQDSFTLTTSQQEIWLAVQMGEDASCAYNLSNTIRLRGSLDRPVLEEAMVELVNLHDSLRMTISAEGIAVIKPKLDCVALEYQDLSGLNHREQADKIKQIALEDVTLAFDLQQGPLVRFGIIRLNEEEHQITITAHHIVSDGWSCSLLLQHLGRLYNGEKNQLNSEVLQFGDYVHWLQQDEQLNRREQDKNYWLKLHKVPAPGLDLPLDRPRPPVKTFSADCVAMDSTPGTYKAVNELAKTHGVTPYHVLLAVFQTLLFRISQQTDFNIGIPVAGQLQADNDNLVGHCVSFLPLRSRLKGRDSFSNLLQTARTMVFDAFEHPFFSYGDLIAELDLPKEPSRNPLVSVVFNVDIVDPGVKFKHLDVRIGSNERRFEIFDLFLDIAVHGDQMQFNCTYNRDLFDAATISRWMELYQLLLQAVLANAEKTL